MSLTAYGRAQAMIAEGSCLLGRLAVAGVEMGCLQLIAAAHLQPIRHLLLLTAMVTADLLLLSPLYLARDSWYDTAAAHTPSLAALSRGWRFYCRAVSWRFYLWRRRSVVVILAALPAAALLGYGEHLRRLGASAASVALWLPFGIAALLLGLMAAGWWSCRYAAAPLLILDGYPAVAAMQLSALVMRRRKREYINLLGAHLWRAVLSVSVVAAPWLLPSYRLARIAWLRAAVDSTAFGR